VSSSEANAGYEAAVTRSEALRDACIADADKLHAEIFETAHDRMKASQRTLADVAERDRIHALAGRAVKTLIFMAGLILVGALQLVAFALAAQVIDAFL
jgi:hypothetical protein